MDPAFLQLVGQFGLPIALVVYFVWRGDKRETRLANRLDAQQDKLEEIYEQTIEKSDRVIEKNSTAILEQIGESRKHREALGDMIATVAAVKCLRPWDGKDRRDGALNREATGGE